MNGYINHRLDSIFVMFKPLDSIFVMFKPVQYLWTIMI